MPMQKITYSYYKTLIKQVNCVNSDSLNHVQLNQKYCFMLLLFFVTLKPQGEFVSFINKSWNSFFFFFLTDSQNSKSVKKFLQQMFVNPVACSACVSVLSEYDCVPGRSNPASDRWWSVCDLFCLVQSCTLDYFWHSCSDCATFCRSNRQTQDTWGQKVWEVKQEQPCSMNVLFILFILGESPQ